MFRLLKSMISELQFWASIQHGYLRLGQTMNDTY